MSYHIQGDLYTNISFSRFWRLGVQVQGPRSGVWWGTASWFVDGHLLKVSSHSREQRERERPQISSSIYKSTSPIYEGSILMTYHPCKGITFKYHYIGDLSFNIWFRGRDTEIPSTAHWTLNPLFRYFSSTLANPVYTKMRDRLNETSEESNLGTNPHGFCRTSVPLWGLERSAGGVEDAGKGWKEEEGTESSQCGGRRTSRHPEGRVEGMQWPGSLLQYRPHWHNFWSHR